MGGWAVRGCISLETHLLSGDKQFGCEVDPGYNAADRFLVIPFGAR